MKREPCRSMWHMLLGLDEKSTLGLSSSSLVDDDGLGTFFPVTSSISQSGGCSALLSLPLLRREF